MNPPRTCPRRPTGYTTVTGTSFAAPFVSGVAALVFSRLYDRLEPVFAKRGIAITMQDIPGRVVEDILRASCDDLDLSASQIEHALGHLAWYPQLQVIVIAHQGHGLDCVRRHHLRLGSLPRL